MSGIPVLENLLRVVRVGGGVLLLLVAACSAVFSVQFFWLLPPGIRASLQGPGGHDTYVIFLFGVHIPQAWAPYTGYIAGGLGLVCAGCGLALLLPWRDREA
jgi:hypothetical protein